MRRRLQKMPRLLKSGSITSVRKWPRPTQKADFSVSAAPGSQPLKRLPWRKFPLRSSSQPDVIAAPRYTWSCQRKLRSNHQFEGLPPMALAIGGYTILYRGCILLSPATGCKSTCALCFGNCFTLANGLQTRREIAYEPDELSLPRRSRLGENVLQMGLDRVLGQSERAACFRKGLSRHQMMQCSCFSGSREKHCEMPDTVLSALLMIRVTKSATAHSLSPRFACRSGFRVAMAAPSGEAASARQTSKLML